MKVVLPVKDGRVFLLRDENGYLRPAMGKSGVDTGVIAEHLFGLHGFNHLIGAVQMGGDTVEFYRLDVAQSIPSTKKSDSPVIEVAIMELHKSIMGDQIALNIFLNLGIRMYYDKLV